MIGFHGSANVCGLNVSVTAHEDRTHSVCVTHYGEAGSDPGGYFGVSFQLTDSAMRELAALLIKSVDFVPTSDAAASVTT